MMACPHAVISAAAPTLCSGYICVVCSLLGVCFEVWGFFLLHFPTLLPLSVVLRFFGELLMLKSSDEGEKSGT